MLNYSSNKMAKRHCYPVSISHSNSGHQDTAFLLDSLYCLEEHWQEDIGDGHSRQKNEAEECHFYRAINININSPNSVILSEQGCLWEDEGLVSLFSKEHENRLHNTLQNNPTLAAARRKAVEWILTVNAHYSFTALTAVLAIDYVDRFLSSIHLQIDKPWMNHLAAVACISIAAKVEETQVPLLSDLQVEENEYFFEAKTIKRMEILVLSTLQWRMNPVNPLSFLDYIVRRLGFKDQLCSEFLGRCERLLLSVILVMASAIMLRVINDIEPCVAAKYQDELLGLLQIAKDKVNDCSRFILEASRRHRNECNRRRFGSIPRSPTGVMGLSCSSINSWQESWSGASSAASSPEPVTKKSKVDEHPLQMLNFTTAAEFPCSPRSFI